MGARPPTPAAVYVGNAATITVTDAGGVNHKRAPTEERTDDQREC
jgi:hypothetical protein